MPNPWMPDWVAVGAIIRPVGALAAMVNSGARYVITVIEFQLSPAPEERGGMYVISINRLQVDDVNPVATRVDQNPREEVIFFLDALIGNFGPTGEWLDTHERVISIGTTTPVSMTTSALRVGEQIHITGAQDPSLNGDFTITEMQESSSLAHGDRNGFGLRLRQDMRTELQRGIDGAPPNPQVATLWETIFNTTVQAGGASDGFQWSVTEDPQASSHIGPPWGDTPQMTDEALRMLFATSAEVQALAEQTMLDRDIFADLDAATSVNPGLIRAEGMHEEPVIETDRPIVGEGQVWQLPAPNVGLWRTSWTHRNLVEEARVNQITLTHTRENDRIMRCTATWLIEHGVRQQPLDPRSSAALPSQAPGGVVSLGQVWEIPAPNGRPRRWVVNEINDRAGKVRLMSEDMPGKRIYLTPAQILQLGTYAGDGLPRRTSYQRILEDNDE